MQGGAVQAGILPFKHTKLVCCIQPPPGKKESIVIIQPFNFKIQAWAFSGFNVFLNLNIFIDMLNTKH